MGLDMYLNKKTYIGANYNHNDIKGEISLTKEDAPINIKLNRITYIEEQVGYWRKASHIHAWFVKNVQEGVDDCGTHRVSKEQLKQLLADCKQVKENTTVAESVLPTQEGFFFGGTEYDEYYIGHIDETIEIVETVLSELETDEDVEIYYDSSW